MSSYKCPQCGLINWNTAETCKRCAAPNPFLSNSIPANFQSQAPAQNTQMYSQGSPAQNQSSTYPQERHPPQNAPGYYQQQPQYAAASPNYSAPPPPNVFGASAGQAENVGAGNWQQPVAQYRPYQQQYQDPEFEQKLAEANKHIRNAWITGVVVCVITVVFSLLITALAPKDIEMSVPLPFILFAVLIYGGLSFGVYSKNRACAVILLCLFILDKIAQFAESGKFQGAIVAFIIIAYFAYGVKGTFDYHKLTKDQKAY